MAEKETPPNTETDNDNPGKENPGKENQPALPDKQKGKEEPGKDRENTSFDKIIEGLQKEVKTLQTKIAQKDNDSDSRNEQLGKLESIVNRLNEIKQPPVIEQGETLLDAILKQLGLDHFWKQ